MSEASSPSGPASSSSTKYASTSQLIHANNPVYNPYTGPHGNDLLPASSFSGSTSHSPQWTYTSAPSPNLSSPRPPANSIESKTSELYQPTSHPSPLPKSLSPSPSPSPSPPPPPSLPKHWHGVIRNFLSCAGLNQALSGLDLDLMVMSLEFEQGHVRPALITLKHALQRLEEASDTFTDDLPLDERKLERLSAPRGIEKQTPASLNKSISTYLSRNRARNNASNQREFLLTPAEKRARYTAQASTTVQTSASEFASPTSHLNSLSAISCARTDARTIDRDVHMKYDFAQNDEGPLRKTLAENQTKNGKSREKAQTSKVNAVDVPADLPTAENHPGLDERITNLEAHLAVKYVPAIPISLLDRLRHLEDHITQLEKDNPPWAALHFNQPRRGWPPPPRSTPIIVDPRTTVGTMPIDQGTQSHDMEGSLPQSVKGKGKAKGSSLHRAIIEKLEIQKAKAEFKTEQSG